MSTLSKMVDPSILEGVQTLLQQAQKDDYTFLALLILTGIFYNVYIKEKPDPYHHIWFERPQAAEGYSKGAETRDIGVKLAESKKDLVIFWGSQSGTAESFANRLVRDCRSRFGVDALAADLSDYDPDTISNITSSKLAIFIISTYGEGDPSDNATQFLSWLDTNKTVKFPKLSYAAFGLGNSKYKFYNKVIDVVVSALDRSGAKSLLPVGKADDANGTTEEDFTAWKQSLFTLFRSLGHEERAAQYEPTLKIIEDTSLDIIDLHTGEPLKPKPSKNSSRSSPIHALPIKTARKLLKATERNCLHIDLSTAEFPELKYKTGDHLAVWPVNPASEIQLLVTALGLQDRMTVPLLIQSIEAGTKVKVPSPTTWNALLAHYLEICGPVPRETVLSLSAFAPDDESKATLKRLGEDKDAYATFCLQHHTTLGRLLNTLNPTPSAWSSIPLPFILEALPLLSPRYYSISSSSIVSPKTISITVSTSTEFVPSSTFAIPGLTSTYLSTLIPQPQTPSQSSLTTQQPKLYTQIRTSKLRLPTLPSHPIILIASGSGLAPFLGFLAERQRLASIGREVGKTLLFFGCRSSEEFIYESELSAFAAGNERVEVVTAFSRQIEGGEGGEGMGGKKGKGKYVQDRIQEREEDMVRMLGEENAYFYICGSAGMARDVKGRVEECVGRRMGWSGEEVRVWSEGLRKGRRWQEDVWG